MDYNKTDPEFVERVTHFISEEVKKEPGQELDDSTRYRRSWLLWQAVRGQESMRSCCP